MTRDLKSLNLLAKLMEREETRKGRTEWEVNRGQRGKRGQAIGAEKRRRRGNRGGEENTGEGRK